MMGEEDMPEPRQWHTSEYELAGDSIPTINHVRCVVDEYDLCRRRTRLSWPRSAPRAEKDQLHLVALRGHWTRQESGTGNGRCPNEKTASIDSHLFSRLTLGFSGAARDQYPI